MVGRHNHSGMARKRRELVFSIGLAFGIIGIMVSCGWLVVLLIHSDLR
jgi:hypothetical protein